MSILNDLDPENARIPSSPGKTSSSLVPWASALLLLVAGVLWIYLGNVFGAKEENTISPVTLASDVPAAPPQSVAPTPAADEGGAALIRATPMKTDETAAATKQPNAFAALQEELVTDGAVTSQTSAVATQGATAKATRPAEQKTRSATTTKRQANKDSTGSQRQAQSSTKPSERDIDIISAIVR